MYISHSCVGWWLDVDQAPSHHPNQQYLALIGVLNKYHITGREYSQGFIEPTHRIPFRLDQPLKIKLDKLEKWGFIQKIEDPTDFINNLIITEKKDGSIRLCLDPICLNEQIMHEIFEISTFEQVAASLVGSKVFTILDQKDSY